MDVVDRHIGISVRLVNVLQSFFSLSVDLNANGNECGYEESPIERSAMTTRSMIAMTYQLIAAKAVAAFVTANTPLRSFKTSSALEVEL